MLARFLAGCLAPLAVMAAAAAEDGFKPGNWEFTVERPDLKFTAGLPPGHKPRPGGGVLAVHTECMTEDDITPSFAAGKRGELDPHCTIDKKERSGATVRWATTCKFPPSTNHSEGVARYEGETMTADFTAHITVPNMPARDMSQHMTGRWLGQCDKK